MTFRKERNLASFGFGESSGAHTGGIALQRRLEVSRGKSFSICRTRVWWCTTAAWLSYDFTSLIHRPQGVLVGEKQEIQSDSSPEPGTGCEGSWKLLIMIKTELLIDSRIFREFRGTLHGFEQSSKTRVHMNSLPQKQRSFACNEIKSFVHVTTSSDSICHVSDCSSTEQTDSKSSRLSRLI